MQKILKNSLKVLLVVAIIAIAFYYVVLLKWDSKVKNMYGLSSIPEKCKINLEQPHLMTLDYGATYYFSRKEMRCLSSRADIPRVKFGSPFKSLTSCQQVCENKK